MESSDEELPNILPEFSLEELEEALKRKSGRPSKRTRELRRRLDEAAQFRDIMGILNSGILEKLGDGFGGTSSERDTGRPERVKPKPESVVEELLLKSGLVNQKFIKTNKNFLGLIDEMISNATVTYGPAVIAVVGALGSLWIAESQVKDFPPILHTSFELLIQLMRLVTVLSEFISGGLGGLTDFVNDPIGTVLAPANQAIRDVLKMDLTEEEKAEVKTDLVEKLRTRGSQR